MSNLKNKAPAFLWSGIKGPAAKKGRNGGHGNDENVVVVVKAEDKQQNRGNEVEVIVKVGGKVYKEKSSAYLMEWSEFFAKAFKEDPSKATFEFPNRRPEEWELISSIINPSKAGKVTVMNYQIVLPWFGELQSKKGLEECDTVISNQLDLQWQSDTTVEHIDLVLSMIWPTLVKYDLSLSKKNCCEFLIDALMNHTLMFTLDHVKLMLAMVQDDEDCKLKIWGTLKGFLPSELDAVVECPASFPIVLHYAMRMKTKTSVMVAAIDLYGSPAAKRHLAKFNDSTVGDMFPAEWKSAYY